MNKIKRFVFVLLIGLVSISLFANGSSESYGAKPADSSAAASIEGATIGKNHFVEGGTDLSLWTFMELHVGFYTSLADAWNAKYPNRPINLTVTTGESSSVHNKLLVACQAGVGTPDIADIEIGNYATFVENGFLLPIDDAIKPYENDIVMSRVNMYDDPEGNHCGVDFHLGATVTYYNMDIMKEAGVDPATIVTWDDYYKAGLKVLEKTGKPMTFIEVGDLFLPQMMMLEKGAQYVDENGNPNFATQAHVDAIAFIRKMMDAGICAIAPGGKYHAEEWYAFCDSGEVASFSLPLWYMGRFISYMPDLKQKIAIYQIPVWKKGDVREVLQGGTGTAVIKYSKNAQLAKDFLAFAKLSDEGNRYIWNILGFDPIRTSLWDDPSITKDPNNQFLAYFLTNPFDVIRDNGTDIVAPDISGSYAACYNVLVSTTYSRAFEFERDTDPWEILKSEQKTVIY